MIDASGVTRNYMATQYLSVHMLIALMFAGEALLAGCTASKETTTSSFDMAEYRKVMERQKQEQAALESTETKAPEMTPEEHERAGDDEAQRRNFPLAGLHYTKALQADPTRNTTRLKLGQIMLQEGM